MVDRDLRAVCPSQTRQAKHMRDQAPQGRPEQYIRNTRVLPGAKTEPLIERIDAARKARTVMLPERFDRFDHARSAEEMSMTLQSLHKTWGWIGRPADCREEGVAIRA